MTNTNKNKMATNIFEIPLLFNDNGAGKHPLIFTSEEFKENYLWGLPLSNPITHAKVTDDMLRLKIIAAQEFLEKYLDIKLFKQLMIESQDYHRAEFSSWGFVRTDYQVNECLSLEGRLNEHTQITYPKEWLTTKKSSDKTVRFPHVYIIPNGMNNSTTKFLAVQYSQYFAFYGADYIPDYWQLKYCTGFDEIPYEIINVIGKIASISILPVLEMGIGGQGAMFGLASQSLSLDGLSQSVSKANGGNIFSQRLKQYGEELKIDLPMLKSMYSGIKFTVM